MLCKDLVADGSPELLSLGRIPAYSVRPLTHRLQQLETHPRSRVPKPREAFVPCLVTEGQYSGVEPSPQN